MKYVFSFILTLLFFPSISHAANISTGDLIRGSSSGVYYYSSRGTRYVFPTERTYLSWYNDFSQVKTMSDTELAAIPLGGNVTYRPGVKMIKIMTDPKVYAVASGGLLRWIQTEQIAKELYGSDWNQNIDDLPDPFFMNYQVVAPIQWADNFSITREQEQSPTIDRDKAERSIPSAIKVPTLTTSTTPIATPAPTITTTTRHIGTGSIETSNPSPKRGERVMLTARAIPSGGIDTIRIFLNSDLLRECTYSPCSHEATIPISGTSSTLLMRADLRWIDAKIATATSTLTIQSGASSIVLRVVKPEIKPNSIREFIVDVDQQFLARITDIFVDSDRIGGCGATQQCRVTDAERSATGTSHQVYAVVTNANQFEQRSDTQTFRVVDNDRPRISIALGKTEILPGEQVDVTIRAEDDDLVSWTEVWINNEKKLRCQTSSCTTTIGPWISSQTIAVSGLAQDILRGIGSATSTSLIVR